VGTVRDVVIVGGAAMGASIAFHLKCELGFAGSVAVIDKDPTFARASTALSAASIRLQFSTPENIRLSQYGVDFLRAMPVRFGPEANPAFHEGGYLIAAGPTGFGVLEANTAIQRQHGADTELLRPAQLAERFPWLSLDGISGATFGPNREGWFDPATMLATFRREAKAAGAEFLTGEVIGMEARVDAVTAVRLADGTRIVSGTVVNAAGPAAGRVAAMAGVALPVEPRKRTVFVLHCRAAPPTMPLIGDVSGVWARPEGAYTLAGWSPPAAEDRTAASDDFVPDDDQFEDRVWPGLAARVPAFAESRVIRSWAGHYEYNTLDQNGIIGPHTELKNLFLCNGFSGHGVQQAPGAGRAIAEMIALGASRTLDVAALGYERIAQGRPLVEVNVI
jgi:FAD-dependent oxidoreductase domain-containing protein 1